MVEEHVGVFEKPGQQNQVQGYAEETRAGGQPQKKSEDDDQRGGAASGGASQVGEEFRCFCGRYRRQRIIHANC